MDDGEGTTTYTYNPKGQLQSQSRAGHRIQYAYDAKGHLQQETKTIHNQSLVKHYTYDAKGRLSTYTSPSGLVQQYGYNAWHDLVSVTDATRGTKLWEATEFNDQGLVSAETNFTGQQTTYDYDGDGRITSIVHPLATSSYAYTLGGLTARRTEAFGNRQLTETFGHDNAGRLWSVQRADAPAVLVTFSRGSRIGIKTDVGSYAYGATPGSPLQQVEPVEGYHPQRQQLTYYKNRMPKTVAQGSYTRTYEYGPDGQRDYSTLAVSGSQPFDPMTTYYFDDYEQNINNKTGALSEIDYIFAEGRLVALVRTENNQRVCYGVLTDRQGSVKALYDAKDLVQRFSYDAWGNRRHPETGALLTATELAEANRITRRGYTGHEHMDEFGLINMNARLYDPRLGMFVSPDPLGEKYYDVHPYTYCGGNPLDAVDPTGMEAWFTDDPDRIRRFWQWLEETLQGGTSAYGFDFGNWDFLIDSDFNVSASYVAPDNKTVTPWEVGFEWLTGLGPRERHFVDGDYFTELLKEHPYIEEVRQLIIDHVRKGEKVERSYPYNLGGFGGIWKYFVDYSTLLTGGLTGNLAVTYLGSYRLNVTNSRIDTELRTVTVDFMVENASTLASATRPPYVGYLERWDKIERFLNASRPSGPMSKIIQIFRWTETLKY